MQVASCQTRSAPTSPRVQDNGIISRLREAIAYASLDENLFVLLTDADDREIIRQTLIYVYLLDFKGGIEDLIAG